MQLSLPVSFCLRATMLVAAVLFDVSARATTLYTVLDLQAALPAGSRVVAQNNNGQLLCIVDEGGAARQRTFIFDGGTITMLGTLPGATVTLGRAINDAKEVVGDGVVVAADGHSYSARRPFLYSRGQIIDFTAGTQVSKTRSSAIDINNKTHVVGNWTDEGGKDRAFLYADGKLVADIGSLGGAQGVTASSINDLDQISGVAFTTQSSLPHAFIYENGTLTDIGTLAPAPNDSAIARGLNNAGDVVGSSRVDTVWQHGFVYKNRALTDIGALGGVESHPASINDAGTVVGVYSISVGSSSVFVYSDGKMIDLKELIDRADPSAAFITFDQVISINNQGVVLAKGRDRRTAGYRDFLLKPKAVRAAGRPVAEQ